MSSWGVIQPGTRFRPQHLCLAYVHCFPSEEVFGRQVELTGKGSRIKPAKGRQNLSLVKELLKTIIVIAVDKNMCKEKTKEDKCEAWTLRQMQGPNFIPTRWPCDYTTFQQCWSLLSIYSLARSFQMSFNRVSMHH